MTCAPGKRDFTVYRGSNAPVIQMRLRNPDGSLQDLTGHDLILTVSVSDGEIVASLSNGGLTIDHTGLIVWAPSLEGSRRVRVGRYNQYAFERRQPDGEQYPLLVGLITGVDYPNAD
ncbi:hypothetical protein GCM10019059_31930 [Camelimonas fluminis]|uniref:Uncharacterized protein n=1 Tax=Camelimonas fluminis TaxID=1576911 RepID=A0ABV7UHP1_9HYPH|nr:hypothetical protein [Camelimonas fluminis]GHE69830.1 hypothetical protein GCM10019059_31930 [Camelimonas fluminis]